MTRAELERGLWEDKLSITQPMFSLKDKNTKDWIE